MGGRANTQTPYELLRRSHRSAQRQVEKDFVNVQAQLSQLLKALSGDEEKDKALALSKLDTASERIRGLKRKLDDLQPNPGPGSQSHVIRERIKYVEDVLLDTRLKKADEGRGKPADVSYRERSESKEKDSNGKEAKDGLAAPQPEKAEKRVSFLDEEGETRDALAAQLDTISGNTTPATPAKPMDG
jgi:macrophage erythroblast attacher